MVEPLGFLGTNFGHDAAAAFIDRDGRLLGAVEEGRLRNEKNCAAFPDLAIRSVLPRHLEGPVAWSEGWNWLKRLQHKGFGAALRFGFRDPALVKSRGKKEWLRFREGERAAAKWKSSIGRPSFVGHHRSHALSLLPWGLPAQSLVLVSDTTGEQESVSTWHWDGSHLLLLNRSEWPNSPGSVLHQAAYHLGFTGERGPGKLMALAAWGDRRSAALPPDLAKVEHGTFHVSLKRYPAYRRDGAWASVVDGWRSAGHFQLAELIAASLHAEEAGADFAAVIQDWFERVLIDLVDDAVQVARTRSLPVEGIGLAGGAALNCQANGRLLAHLDARDLGPLIVSPWSNDAGTAIGAAVAGALGAGVEVHAVESALLGPSQSTWTRCDLDIDLAVAALRQGETVGLVSSGVELGPRALGGRCLLADPQRAQSKERLNHAKGRPSFMPFSPALLREECSTWFSGNPSRNMAWTIPYSAEAAKRFPGIRHPSGEARVQAVTRSDAPALNDVLGAARKAGMPMLLLTSLNGAGEPMLSNHADSIRAARGIGASGCLSDSGWDNFG